MTQYVEIYYHDLNDDGKAKYNELFGDPEERDDESQPIAIIDDSPELAMDESWMGNTIETCDSFEI